MAIKVFCLDDHELFRAGIRALLGAEPDMELVGEAADAAEALTTFAAQCPDVVLVDVSLDGLDGVEFARQATVRYPRCKVLMVTAHSATELVTEAFDAGASGYARKDQPPSELFAAVRVIAAGELYLAPVFPQSRLEARRVPPSQRRPTTGTLASLSPRERQIFELLIRGFTNEATAAELSISIKTVQTHRAKINDKLDLHSSADLLRFAARRGCLRE